jgi:TrbC/VIRB2 pilin
MKGKEKKPMIGNFTNIATVITNVSNGVFKIASVLAILMVIIAGVFLMFDRDTSMAGRLQKLGFLKTVLLGYAIIFAANFLITTINQALGSGGIAHP